MHLTDEDKLQYELIEDKDREKIIGSVENMLSYLNDMIDYNLNNTDDEETIKDIKIIIKNINQFLDRNIDKNTIIAIFDNPMCGLDWQLVEYNYI